MDDWKKKIKEKLINFYKELDGALVSLNRKGQAIKVLFATKYLNSGQLTAFADLYQQLRGEIAVIGENRVQDAEEKFNRENANFTRVMIGNLQKNKINKALFLFDEIWGINFCFQIGEIKGVDGKFILGL